MAGLSMGSHEVRCSLKSKNDTSNNYSTKSDCTDPDACTYKFRIDVGDGRNATACTVIDLGKPATNHSFYDVPCQGEVRFHILS